MKKSPYNQRYIETILRLRYHLNDLFKYYDFLGQDMKAEGDVNVVVGQVFAMNHEKEAQGFLSQVKLLKDMDALVNCI